MKTDDLIDTLANGDALARSQRRPLWAVPLLAAIALCAAGLTFVLGAPLQPLAAIGPAPFVMKIAFSGAIAVSAALALKTAATPGRRMRTRLLAVAAPFAVLLVLSGMELAAGDAIWPGSTWLRCISAIALGSLPTFAAAIAVTRRFAPTNLRLSGALAGLFAAAGAATAYAFWCPETNAIFLLSWYALPILFGGLIGALLGPRLLRW